MGRDFDARYATLRSNDGGGTDESGSGQAVRRIENPALDRKSQVESGDQSSSKGIEKVS